MARKALVQTVDFNEIAIFVKVAQLGSFTQAAKQLNMPNSTVSARVSSLEKRLGVTLIRRTTRQLNLTEAGRNYFQKCMTGLGEIQNAEAEVTASQTEPHGLFRITAPQAFGTSILSEVICDYMRANPKVDVDLILTDRVVDLVSEGIDLAIRGGDLKDSSFMMKRLGTSFFASYASAAYLKKHGTPSHPKDLREHNCLHFPAMSRDAWEFTSEKTKSRVSVALPGRYQVNDLGMLKSLTTKGIGISLLPSFIVGPDLKSGKLVRVLPDWVSNKRAINLVYPAQRFVNPNVQAFIAVAAKPLADCLPGDQ